MLAVEYIVAPDNAALEQRDNDRLTFKRELISNKRPPIRNKRPLEPPHLRADQFN